MSSTAHSCLFLMCATGVHFYLMFMPSSVKSSIVLCYNINKLTYTHTYTHTHPFNGPLSETTQVSRYHKSKTNLDFTGARDSEWQWHQLGHMQVCTSLQTDSQASTSILGCPSCRPTNSVKALKAHNKLTYFLA